MRRSRSGVTVPTVDPVAQRLRVYQDAEAGLLHTLAVEVRRAINRGDDPGEAQACGVPKVGQQV